MTFLLQTAKRLRLAAIALAALAACSAAGLEAFDRLYDSSLPFALRQARSEAFGERSPLELEAKALLAQVSRDLDLPELLAVRVGLGDGLSERATSARFNSLNFRIVISERLIEEPAPYRRFVLLHEIGHAVAQITGAQPRWLGARSPQTNEVLSQSLLGSQLFHESYADLFAITWALRQNPADSGAWRQIGMAMGAPPLRPSAAHNTFISERLLKPRLESLRQSRPAELLQGVQDIASEGAAITIAHFEAEREAVCFMGPRALAKYARNTGYASAHLPWENAQTFPLSPGEPYAEAIEELASLRSRAPFANPWRQAIWRSRDAIAEALAAGAQDGLSPQAVGELAKARLFASHRDALSVETFAASHAAAQLARAQSQPPWIERLYERALEAADSAFPAPSPSCPKL